MIGNRQQKIPTVLSAEGKLNTCQTGWYSQQTYGWPGRRNKALDGIGRQSLIEELRFDGTLTGFGQRDEAAKVVQVNPCPPGLIDHMVARLQSMEQSLAKRQYPG